MTHGCARLDLHLRILKSTQLTFQTLQGRLAFCGLVPSGSVALCQVAAVVAVVAVVASSQLS